MRIECTEKEKEIIEELFEDNCPFQLGTIATCNEDARCGECIEENIEFIVIELGAGGTE